MSGLHLEFVHFSGKDRRFVPLGKGIEALRKLRRVLCGRGCRECLRPPVVPLRKGDKEEPDLRSGLRVRRSARSTQVNALGARFRRGFRRLMGQSVPIQVFTVRREYPRAGMGLWWKDSRKVVSEPDNAVVFAHRFHRAQFSPKMSPSARLSFKERH